MKICGDLKKIFKKRRIKEGKEEKRTKTRYLKYNLISRIDIPKGGYKRCLENGGRIRETVHNRSFQNFKLVFVNEHNA